MILMGYIYMRILKNLLSYYFIDLCHILHRSKLGQRNLLFYRNY